MKRGFVHHSPAPHPATASASDPSLGQSSSAVTPAPSPPPLSLPSLPPHARWLIEILVEGLDKELNLGEVTQEGDGQPRDNWQVPYDEQPLEAADGKSRYAFFFHYLDLGKRLRTSLGISAASETDEDAQALESHQVRGTVTGSESLIALSQGAMLMWGQEEARA
jgi:hypothetical protein